MRKQKQIVGKFNNDLSKIEFYEIIDNFKHFTLLRKQGTAKHYIRDNNASLLSNEFYIDENFSEVADTKQALEQVKKWYFGDVFFWADSIFVTAYGSENYDKLVNIYSQLLDIKQTEAATNFVIEGLLKDISFFEYIKYKWQYYRLERKKHRTIRQFEKEYKVIW